MRGLDKFLLISGAFLIVTSLAVRNLPRGEDGRELEFLKAVFPQAQRFLPQTEPFPHYQALARDWQTGDAQLIGYCFDTAEIVPQVKGYGGLIHILVGLDLSGHLVGVEIREHVETPFFVEGFQEPWFTAQFVGKGVEDPLVMGQDLDGLSGATISSMAVARGIRESLAMVVATLLGTPQAQGEVDLGVHRWWLEAGALLALMALSLVAFWRREKGLRVVSLILSLGIVGFYLNGSLSVVHLVNVINLRFPPFPAHVSWYLLLFFGVVTALMVGRIYCGWLCPFGALQEFLKKLVPYRLRLSPAVHRTASRLRALLLWLVICLVILSGSQELLRYEPFAMAFSLRGTYLMWASLVLILVASGVIDRFWCRYFCVVGMVLHLLGKLGLRRKRGARLESAEMVGDF